MNEYIAEVQNALNGKGKVYTQSELYEFLDQNILEVDQYFKSHEGLQLMIELIGFAAGYYAGTRAKIQQWLQDAKEYKEISDIDELVQFCINNNLVDVDFKIHNIFDLTKLRLIYEHYFVFKTQDCNPDYHELMQSTLHHLLWSDYKKGEPKTIELYNKIRAFLEKMLLKFPPAYEKYQQN